MKKLLVLALLASTFGCGTDNPPPPQPQASNYGRGRAAKAPPQVQGGRAEDFRAVERPSTYSGDE